MSNGTTCCAGEICCDGAAARVAVRKALVERGSTEEHCDTLFAFMDHEGLMFADESLRPFVQRVAGMAKKHVADAAGV